ncbi:hypothetical protein [Chryseobacterium sp. LAM-KRS1]|uniref:hypothetical protein n=1 Tax=Chryseobacterium sp. LAM-KRS1 TaxID=2715754 RepID=UPI0015528FFE|nr:hypothetical protein [Chryseobacterium sp. LAM-KRS1]
MAYTVISIFPANADVEGIKKELQNQGFKEADIIVSKSKLENGTSADDYEEDEKTKSFWDHIFVNEIELLTAYREGSIGKINIIVYTENIEDARKAKVILNESGAIEVKKEAQNTVQSTDKDTAGLPEDVYKGIIAKAKHNVYFLDPERVYRPNSRGMDARMDTFGSKD